jgi:hypothetical protein
MGCEARSLAPGRVRRDASGLQTIPVDFLEPCSTESLPDRKESALFPEPMPLHQRRRGYVYPG